MRKEDNINNSADIFTVRSRTSYPINSEIELTLDDERIFKGVIISVENAVDALDLPIYTITAKDYSQYLNRKLVTERFEDKTISEIITSLLQKYAPEFTMNNVSGDQEINIITFDRINISECLDKLAELTAYSWYVDYYKDIHFFEKNEEPAPYNLDDTSGNYIFNSLILKDDLSQIRNRIIVRGGEYEGNERTEEFTAPAEADERLFFRLANKFARMPSVSVNGSAVSVGVDFLFDEDSSDAFWDFNQKYIRFKSDTAPAEGDIVTVTGIPLFRVVTSVSDSTSLSLYGAYEFAIFEESIKTREEAIVRGLAELEAYASGVVEGSFDTYRPGLRSGQIITVQSDIRGINEQFLIQKVTMNTHGRGIFRWNVKLASLRTMTIIGVLQMLLRRQQPATTAGETLLTLANLADTASVVDSYGGETETEAPYIWLSDDPDEDEMLLASLGYDPIVWNLFTWDS